jgi:hypothetical protein
MSQKSKKRVITCKREKVTRGWGKCIIRSPHNLYSSPNIVRVIKSGIQCNAYKILVAKMKGRNYLEDLGVDGRTILE